MSRSIKQIIIFILMCTLIQPCLAEEDVLSPEQWPITVKATVTDIISRLSEKDKKTVKNTNKENLIQFQHGLGTGIRNYYGLWRGNKKLIIDACIETCHPDDASMIIIDAVWQKLQES